jgi:hypothetical protein
MGFGGNVVEWRVFIRESAVEGVSFPFFHDAALLTSLNAPRARTEKEEEVRSGSERGFDERWNCAGSCWLNSSCDPLTSLPVVPCAQ